jgi:hypothetical protein
MLNSISDWLDVTKTLAAASLLISLINAYFTWQNRRLAMTQEQRRLPRLALEMISCHFEERKDKGGRVYAFYVTITNPTDSNNAIAEADLWITYLRGDRVQMTMNVRANEPEAKSLFTAQDQALQIPGPVLAHNVISGWLRFFVPAAMLINRDIEGYRLTLTDPHGESVSVVPILVHEKRDDP